MLNGGDDACFFYSEMDESGTHGLDKIEHRVCFTKMCFVIIEILIGCIALQYFSCIRLKIHVPGIRIPSQIWILR